MSTITPTSDQRQILDVTTFTVGDTVQSKIDGRIGTIIKPDGFLPTLVPLPVPHIEFLPQPVTPRPLATPAPPTTSNVNVSWIDGTFSIVPLSTLSHA